MDLRRLLAVELDGVADQVLEQLAEPDGIPDDRWQWIVGDRGTTLLNADLQASDDPGQERLQIDLVMVFGVPPGS